MWLNCDLTMVFYPILANLYVDAFVTSVILPLLLRIPFSFLFSSVEGNFMVMEAYYFLFWPLLFCWSSCIAFWWKRVILNIPLDLWLLLTSGLVMNSEHTAYALGVVLNGRVLPSSHGSLAAGAVGLAVDGPIPLPTTHFVPPMPSELCDVMDLEYQSRLGSQMVCPRGLLATQALWNQAWWLAVKTCKILHGSRT